MATPSFAMIPSAYKEGKLAAVLPAAENGEQLVLTTLDNTTGWLDARGDMTFSTTGNSIVGTVGGAGGTEGISTELVTEIGKTYKVIWDFERSNSAGVFYLRASTNSSLSGTLVDIQTTNLENKGEVTFVATSNPTYVGTLVTLSVPSDTVTINFLSVIEPIVDNGDFTVTRASSAARINKEGLLETVGHNVVQLNYPIGGGCPTLLLEPKSTNILPNSEDFSTWGGAIVVAPSTSPSPTGELNATTYTNVGTNNIDRNKSVIQTANLIHTATIYIKNTGSTFSGQTAIKLSIYGGGVPTTSLNLGDLLNAATLNEWVRYELNIPTYTSTITRTLQLRSDEACSVDIFGAQLEVQDKATSYIQTTGEAASRLLTKVTGGGSSSDFNSEEGVLFAEMSAVDMASGFRSITLGPNGNNRAFLQYTNSNTISGGLVVGGSPQGILFDNVTSILDTVKAAYRWKLNDFALFVNGVKVDDSGGTVFSPGILNTLNLSGASLSEELEAEVRQILVFSTALTDADLIGLTSQDLHTSYSVMATDLGFNLI